MLRGVQGEGMRAIMAQRIYARKKIRLGEPEARGIAAGEVDESILAAIRGAGIEARGGLLREGRAAAMAGGAGVPQGRAALQAQEIDVGSRMIKVQFTLERAQLNAAGAAGVLQKELEALARAAEVLSKLSVTAAKVLKTAIVEVPKALETMSHGSMHHPVREFEF